MNATHILLHPEFSSPYSLLIDEFFVALSMDDNYDDYLQQDFFGIKEEVKNATSNTGQNDEEISELSHEVLSSTCAKVIDKMKSMRADFIDENLNKIWKELGFGEKMPEKIVHEIYQEITSEKKPLGNKYTFEDMKESILKVLKKYVP